jgi:hypothetical protein
VNLPGGVPGDVALRDVANLVHLSAGYFTYLSADVQRRFALNIQVAVVAGEEASFNLWDLEWLRASRPRRHSSLALTRQGGSAIAPTTKLELPP